MTGTVKSTVDDFPPITMGGGAKREALPKGSYKVVVTEVKWSAISEWPEWKVESAVERHNEREAQRVKDYAEDGKTYEPHEAYLEDGVVSGLSLAESSQYVFLMRVVGGKRDGELVRPYYTGVSLHKDKKYRTKSNLYKLLDAALPDVEAAIADGTIDPREVVGYPFMAALDLTEQGNNKVTSFMQSDDHGERIEVTVEDDAPDIAF